MDTTIGKYINLYFTYKIKLFTKTLNTIRCVYYHSRDDMNTHTHYTTGQVITAYRFVIPVCI